MFDVPTKFYEKSKSTVRNKQENSTLFGNGLMAWARCASEGAVSVIAPPLPLLLVRNGMSGSARGGAEHLARIHGTEEDKVSEHSFLALC